MMNIAVRACLVMAVLSIIALAKGPFDSGHGEANAEARALTSMRIVVPAVVREAPCDLESLAELLNCGSRAALATWASTRSILELNAAVADLDEDQLHVMAMMLLDSNATGAIRATLLGAMAEILAVPTHGFYMEIWSYTRINIEGDGLFGTCGQVYLTPGSYGGLSAVEARNVFMHESYHSFNCVNGGPSGALDEGAGIWTICVAFPTSCDPSQSWAENTYGTKLFYRDFQGQPDYPLGVASSPSTKLLEVFEIWAERDPSKLPWNDDDKLKSCYLSYWDDLQRDVDYYAVWLPSQAQAAAAMLNDEGCRPD